jgi:hypothetical protein
MNHGYRNSIVPLNMGLQIESSQLSFFDNQLPVNHRVINSWGVTEHYRSAGKGNLIQVDGDEVGAHPRRQITYVVSPQNGRRPAWPIPAPAAPSWHPVAAKTAAPPGFSLR